MVVLIDRFELRLIVQGFESMLARMNKRITNPIEINFNWNQVYSGRERIIE